MTIDWTEVIIAVATIAVGGTGAMAIRLMAHILKEKKGKNIEAMALDALLEGMALAQDTVVRPAKKKGKLSNGKLSNGKLSNDLIEKAEEVAMGKAKTVATGAALKMLESWSGDTAKSKIKGLLKWGNTAK